MSSLIYTNNNSVISYENVNNLTIKSISGNLVYLQNQINNCMDLGGYDILNSSLLVSNQNLPYELTISAAINLNYGVDIIPGWETYNTQGGANTVSCLNYLRFVYGRNWCISCLDDSQNVNPDNLYFKCGSGGNDNLKFTLGYTAITTPLPINGVSQLQMSYLSTLTSNVQTHLNNCVMFGDLYFNNNLIYVNNTSYVNGLYNTLSSYIRTTNTNLNNY